MPNKTVAQKLLIKEGYTLLFVNPPQGYKARLGSLPKNVKVLTEPTGPADLIQVFVDTRKDLEAQLQRLKPALKPKGLLWVTYHKGTSKIKTDINRDSIAAYAPSVGMEGVALISIDDDWSAIRLKIV
ncbi:MAG: hypothetical protein HY260_19850 [Chloroflexi bacterium]|nr:hypothetical protein [Chloroflexota bacterium]